MGCAPPTLTGAGGPTVRSLAPGEPGAGPRTTVPPLCASLGPPGAVVIGARDTVGVSAAFFWSAAVLVCAGATGGLDTVAVFVGPFLAGATVAITGGFDTGVVATPGVLEATAVFGATVVLETLGVFAAGAGGLVAACFAVAACFVLVACFAVVAVLVAAFLLVSAAACDALDGCEESSVSMGGCPAPTPRASMSDSSHTEPKRIASRATRGLRVLVAITGFSLLGILGLGGRSSGPRRSVQAVGRGRERSQRGLRIVVGRRRGQLHVGDRHDASHVRQLRQERADLVVAALHDDVDRHLGVVRLRAVRAGLEHHELDAGLLPGQCDLAQQARALPIRGQQLGGHRPALVELLVFRFEARQIGDRGARARQLGGLLLELRLQP